MAQESPGLQQLVGDFVARPVVDEFDGEIVGLGLDRVRGLVDVEATAFAGQPSHLPTDPRGMVQLLGELLLLGVPALGALGSVRKRGAR